VFATLHDEGARAVDMAAWMGITRQSMGEIIRDMVGLGILEMVPDPADRRAKLVQYSELGLRVAADGFNHIRDLERRFLLEFGEQEWATTRRVLQRVAEIVETESLAESAKGVSTPPAGS
jgi:DNA-binding MarR family transcriptional regulator